MNDRAPEFDPRVIEMINTVQDGDGPPAYHVRDEEARIATIVPCALAPLVRAELTSVALGPYAATVWLPSLELAEAKEVPDATWQSWEWPSGESILLYAQRDPELPGVHALTLPNSSMCHVIVAGRPMRVRRFGPGDPAWRGDGHVAEVHGFLDDRTSFWAQLEAPTAERRDLLLAALCTLEVAEPERRSS
jgi:hypothetical protein